MSDSDTANDAADENKSVKSTLNALMLLVSCIRVLRLASKRESFSSDIDKLLLSKKVDEEDASLVRFMTFLIERRSVSPSEEDRMEEGARRILSFVANDLLQKDELRYLLARSIQASLEASNDASRLAQSSAKVRAEVELLLSNWDERGTSEHSLS